MSDKKKQVLAFDFGGGSGRAILGTLENGKIHMEEVHRFSNDPVIVNGTMYWDTLRHFFEIKQGIVKAKQKGGFESIGIDTWGVDFGLLDEHGDLLESAVHYRDDRTLGMQEEVFKVIPKEEVYNLTGNQFENFNTIFQLYSLVQKRPWILEKADTLLLTPDLFNYFLTGEKKAEYTMATTTQLMDTFADMLRSTAKELEKSLFSDERLEKKLASHLKKRGIRVLYSSFFLNREGKYEVHLTARAVKNTCVTIKALVKAVSEVMGRQFIAESDQAFMLGKEYQTIVCMEGPVFYTLYGVARIGKDCNKISGDNFMMRELGGGKLAVALSDGMGSGEKACRESTLVMELLEELLEAGFPAKAAIQMINTTLVMGREEIHFSTVDLSMFDLYTGECRLIKAGASSTFIKKGNKVERISSSSLPIGVMHSIEIESVQRTLEDGDFVVMITDGVLDALPVGEQDLLMETIIGGTTGGNPKELAHHILEQVLNWTGEEPMDDMTVLAVGIWNCQDTCILGTDSV